MATRHIHANDVDRPELQINVGMSYIDGSLSGLQLGTVSSGCLEVLLSPSPDSHLRSRWMLDNKLYYPVLNLAKITLFR